MKIPRPDNLRIKQSFRENSVSGKIALILSTWFGSGTFPFAPGTAGTLAAIPLILLSNLLGLSGRIILLLIITGIGIWAADRTQNLLKKKDPSAVVIDEVAGFMVAMLLLPMTWVSLCLAFFLFRAFDVLKPFPIKNLEKLKGGFGIVLDDLLAGVYAFLTTWLILHYLIS